MLVARVLPPLPDSQLPQQLSLAKPSGQRIVKIVTPRGGLLVRRLAADLAGLGYELAWVRPLPFEPDPGSLAPLLLTALSAARRDSHPGREPVIVLELPGAGQAESLLSQLLPAGPPDAYSPTVVLVVDGQHRAGPGEDARAHGGVPRCEDIEVPRWEGRKIPGCVTGPQRPRLPLRQLSEAAGGLPGLIEGSLRSLPRLGATEFSRVVAKAGEPGALTRGIAGELLSGAPAEELAALEMAGYLGYAHERLTSLEPALAAAEGQPWWVPLTNGWLQVDPAWQPALVAAAGAPGASRAARLSRLVAELAEEGAIHEGIELCINAGWPGLAADLLAGEAELLLSAGRHATVERWLERLLPGDHGSHRGLAKLAGELAAAGPRKAPPCGEQAGMRPGEGRAGAPAEAPAPAAAVPAKRFWPFRRTGHGPPVTGDWPAGPVDAGGPPPAALPGPPPRDDPASPGALHVEARLLGPFELVVGGQPVPQWRGTRGRMLLAYLLLHRGRPLTRDELGGVFWPDAAPDVVRNRLHVALYGLRRDLRALSGHPIVIHSGRGFSLHPRVGLWIDAEAFDEAVAAARKAGRGRPEETLARYEAALRLYRGELLEDTPFEEWTLLCRERLRLQHLEALDQVARLRFELGRYADCLEACHRLIPGDLCREDMHRLVMVCYARLNQPHLAVRQYHQCRRQLRDELGIEPAETTRQLYERIRRQEAV